MSGHAELPGPFDLLDRVRESVDSLHELKSLLFGEFA